MSTNHFNQLTEAEQERLSILVEECGEVLQIVGKIQRHGYYSFDPTAENSKPNRVLLGKEIGDLKAAIQRMVDNIDFDLLAAVDSMTDKLSNQKYLHHQDN